MDNQTSPVQPIANDQTPPLQKNPPLPLSKIIIGMFLVLVLGFGGFLLLNNKSSNQSTIIKPPPSMVSENIVDDIPSQPEENLATFNNPNYDFTFTYPQDWETWEMVPGQANIMIGPKNDIEQFKLLLSSGPNEESYKATASLSAMSIGAYPEGSYFPATKESNPDMIESTVQINNKEFKKRTYPIQPPQPASITYDLLENDKYYSLGHSQGLNDAAFNKIINSFKINPE